MTEQESTDYRARVFRLVQKIAVGQFFDIAKNVAIENKQLFIFACIEFMEHMPDFNYGLQFNSDYTIINRCDIF